MELALWRTRIVEVYPNPASQSVVIEFERGDRGAWSIDLFTTNGVLVARLADGDGETGKYAATIALGDLPAGAYLIQLRCSDGIDTKSLEISR